MSQAFKTLVVSAALVAGAGLSGSMIAAAQDAGQRTLDTGSGIPLSQDAPDRYTVKQGDTLWDIAKVFLRDPWYWPEIWYVNPQIKNPHLIYPGDILALVSVEGRPQVSVAERGPEGTAAETPEQTTRSGSGVRLSPRVRSQPITAAVTAVPYEAVAGFMGRPSMVTAEQLKTAPYVVGIRDLHAVGGEDNDVYGRGISKAALGTRYTIVHVDDPLKDPETNKILGYRGVYAGEGAVALTGDPAKIVVDKTEREILRGDKLFEEEVALALDFIPHPVPENIKGTVMAVDGVTMAGQYRVIAVNRGTAHGIESGHVFAINQRGETVKDIYKEGSNPAGWTKAENVRLPDERIGTVMIFKAYDRMSYGLIMESTHPVRTGDLVGPP